MTLVLFSVMLSSIQYYYRYLVLLNNRFIYYQFLVTLLMGIYGIIVDDPFIKVGIGPFIMLDNDLKVD